jgi:hypothetical protein
MKGHANGTSEVAEIVRRLQIEFAEVIKRGKLKFRIGPIRHCHRRTSPRFREKRGMLTAKIHGRSGCQTFIAHGDSAMRRRIQKAIVDIWRNTTKWNR